MAEPRPELSETVNQCPCCGERDREPFEEAVQASVLLRYWICSNCGLVYLSPRMSEEDSLNYYAVAYRKEKMGDYDPAHVLKRASGLRPRHQVAMLKDFLDETPRFHVDIGSGVGALGQAIREEFGSQSVGVEPDDAARAFAISNGLETFTTYRELRDELQRRPDLITISHVLEHLHDPIGMLRDLRGLLTDGGHLLAEVPNLYFHKSYELTHLYAFAPDVLSEVLRVGGFRTRARRIHGRPRSWIRPSYITLIAEPDPDFVEGDVSSGPTGKKLRRKVGMALVRIWTLSRAVKRRISSKLGRESG